MPSGPVDIGSIRPVPLKDLFPEGITSDEVDRRIANSENRVKYWVAACAATNLILALPTIFYMGRMAQSVQTMSDSVTELKTGERGNQDWVRDRMIWEARVESALHEKGVEVK